MDEQEAPGGQEEQLPRADEGKMGLSGGQNTGVTGRGHDADSDVGLEAAAEDNNPGAGSMARPGEAGDSQSG